jgi:phospholipid/cholesterol/gamma-HCH transport system substrate-binding protein
MQQSKTVETWVGLFVALGVVGLFFLAMKVSNLGDLQTKENSFKITARFQNAGSLRERAPVSMAGVRVGRISAIRFDKETYEAVVEMRIDPEYDTIPTDTTANVLTAGLLGEQYIGLSAGGSDEFLKDGDEIELTQSAMVLEEVISRFLFNKAESGSEKKETAIPTAVTSDVKADTSVTEEMPAAKAEPIPSDNEAEPPAVPVVQPVQHHEAKPKHHKVVAKPVDETDETTESASKPKAHSAKPAANEAHVTAHKPKPPHGKTTEETDSVHKPTKPAPK